MWFNINIDFKKIHKNWLDQAKEKLDKFADKVIKWVKSRTPEDTKELLNSIDKTEQTFTWRFLLQQVKPNKEIDYLAPVEYWVMWKNYNYNKPKWTIFYVWVWAWMFRKTYFDLKDKFNENE